MPTKPRQWSLARQLLVLQAAIVGVLAGAGFLLAYLDADSATDTKARDKVTVVARTVSDAPSVRTALSTPDPSAILQPFAEKVRRDTEVDFITIMNTGGIRFTHPTPALIGQRYIGTTAEALQGRVFTETYTGSLGPSVRTIVPVLADGQVVAMVAVGITVDEISADLHERLWTLAAVIGSVLIAGLAGSLLVSARVRRQTHGVAPVELRDMFSYHEAVLHAVREGLVLVGSDGVILLCNDGARDLLDVADPTGSAVTDLGLPDGLAEAFMSSRADEIHVTDSRVLVVNVTPVSMGTVVTLRDHTELQTLTGELNTVRGFAEALRSQAHEAANRLHTVVSLVEIGRPREAVEFATAELQLAQQLTDRVVGAVEEPVLAALLLGKAAEAAERGIDLTITEDTAIEDTAIAPRDLVTILGNLIDNAIEAASSSVVVTARSEDGSLLLRVSDDGPGVPPGADVFRRGWSTKPAEGHGVGLALVGQAVRRHNGTVEVGRESGAVFTVRLPL